MEFDLGQKTNSFYHSRKELETISFEYNTKIQSIKVRMIDQLNLKCTWKNLAIVYKKL